MLDKVKGMDTVKLDGRKIVLTADMAYENIEGVDWSSCMDQYNALMDSEYVYVDRSDKLNAIFTVKAGTICTIAVEPFYSRMTKRWGHDIIFVLPDGTKLDGIMLEYVEADFSD